MRAPSPTSSTHEHQLDIATKAYDFPVQPSLTFFYGANADATAVQGDLAGLGATATVTVKPGDAHEGQTLDPAYPTVFGFGDRQP